MPEPVEVRVLARLVGARMELTPWWDHRDKVLPEVYRRLGLGTYRVHKRRKQVAPPPESVAECAVCMEADVPLIVLVPCGHRRICGVCAARCNNTCPICRASFRGHVERIYD